MANLAFDDGSMTIGEFNVVRNFFIGRGYLETQQPASPCPVCGGERTQHTLYSEATGRLMLSKRDYIECPNCKTVEN